MKKGFTLVELLGVLIILSIIGLITLPIATGYIENSKKASYKSSVQTVLESAKEYVNKFEENSDFPEGGIDITKVNLNLKKDNFSNGYVKRNEQGEVEVINIYNGEYCANGTKQSMVIEKVDSVEDCNKVDASRPDLSIKVVDVTSTKIKVSAVARDAQSGIKDYKYCIGDICSDFIDKNNYTFDNLRNDEEYEIIVTVRNNNYDKNDQYTSDVTTTTKKIYVKTKDVNVPEFRISSNNYSSSKEVTIIYPNVQGYIKSYVLIDNNGKTVLNKTTENYEEKLIINQNGTLKAYVTNGSDILENEIIIRGVDNSAPDVYVIMSDDWENSKQIEVIVRDSDSGPSLSPYSYNGGGSWTNNNKRAYKENTTVNLVVRDKLNNQTKNYRVCKGKDTSGNPTGCGNLVDGGIKINKVDTVPPTCTLKVTSGILGLNNWYTSDLTIGFDKFYDQAKDPSNPNNFIEGSGIVKSSIDKLSITSEGTSTIIGTVEDKLGNKSTCSLTVKMDKTAPTYTFTPSGTAYGSGYKSGLKVTTTCSDRLSSATGTNTKTLSAQGTNTVSGTCTDEAGNKANYSQNYLIYVYSADQAACGTTKVDCNPYACGWDSCATGSYNACQGGYVTDYGNCTNYTCTLYARCQNSACGCATTGTCTTNYITATACRNQCSGICSGKTCSYSCCKLYNTCRTSACGTESASGSACNNANSKVCSSYGSKWDSCATTTNTCQGGYTSTCYNKCDVAVECWHT